MKVYLNGHRFRNYDEFEHLLNQPYNYAKEGLLKHLISHKIIESKNRVLQYMLRFVDYSFTHLLKYTDELRYFKNYLWKNR